MNGPAFSFTSRVRPVIEIGIGAANVPTGLALWDDARWDDPGALWAGDEPAWHEVTCDGISALIRRDRARNTDRFTPAECTIEVENITGWADGTSSADVPGELSLRPGRPIRVGVTHVTLGTFWRFRGTIDSVTPKYDAEETDTSTFVCTDVLGEVGRAKVTELDPSGAGEFAHDRFDRVLDAVPWLSSKRIVAMTGTTLVAGRLDGQVEDLLGRIADSIGGACFGDVNGNVVLAGQEWQSYAEGADPDGTIGNTDPSDVCPSGWLRPFDRRDIATRVILDRELPADEAPAEPLVFDDQDGQVRYGVEPFERLDLWTESDGRLTTIGSRILVARGAGTMPRIEAVSLDAANGDSTVDLMAQMSVHKPSRYRCLLQLPRGEVFDADHFVTGLVETITPDSWEIEASMDLATPFMVGAGAEWDENNGWDRSMWAA